ncbi:MAG: protein translocase subunit SecD [Chloroflexi bacterium]|nr:protein translocase subunit SecD [Chloroflexota bacterium]
MRRVGYRRIILILVVLFVSVASLANKSFEISFLGVNLERGSDSILGLRLGLDLQGGIHLVYQARGTKEVTATFQAPPDVELVRTALTSVGLTETTVSEPGEDGRTVVIGVSTLQPAQEGALREALEEQVGPLEPGGLSFADVVANPTADQMQGVLDTIGRRVNPLGVAEPVIQLMGSDRILVQLPGISDVEEVKTLIGQTARLEFRERLCLTSAIDCDAPDGHEPDRPTGLTGDDLRRAFPGTHSTTGVAIVNLQFNSRGTRIFRELTTRLYDRFQQGFPDRFVILLDEDELLAPVVANGPILTGNPFISGPDFTPSRVRTLAIQLESGRLPIPIEAVQEQSVDATLGAESLRMSLIAGIVGLGLVLLFMVLYYRMAGVVAALALLVYTTAVLAIFKLVPVTLTLGGVAAFVLSIGMAVDANILIFERMKEELRVGRTLVAAIEIGFSRAWPAIRDSNVSTFITCAILFWFGQRLGNSLVSGFALTLFIGVAASMFSALTVSRTLLHVFASLGLEQQRKLFTPERLRSEEQASGSGVAEERS